MNKYQIVKIIISILLITFVLTQFKQPGTSNVPFEEVSQKTIEKIDMTELVQQDNLAIKRFLSLNPESYEAIVYYKNADPMKAQEFVLVKFSDTSQAVDFKLMMEQRIENQKNVFDGYIEEQSQLLKKATIDVRGNYAFYCVSENCMEVDQSFKNSL
ncbi:DUF4358 domain-containing protein [Floccifex sp.]|uniref:DUF4358 domain-containing protein n=1 Tax=Floccifex sp. TaxID=2815810 RepID=UPI003F045F24